MSGATDTQLQATHESSSTIDVQPGTKESPEAEAIPLAAIGQDSESQDKEVPEPQPIPIKRRRVPVWRARFYRAWRILVVIFGGLGRVLFIVLCAIGVAAIFAIFLALSTGIAAANGSIMLLIGNAILRAAHLNHYTGNREAAIVGAVGGILAGLSIGTLFETCVPKTTVDQQGNPQHSWWAQCIGTVLLGTLSGAIGGAIMSKHIDLKGLDPLHAMRAGAVGGAILGPGSILLYPIIFLVVGIILSPLWIAMVMGFEFISVKSREDWGENWHGYSFCLCYGSCGGDSEIEDEVQRIEDMKVRHATYNQSSMV